MTAHKGSLNQYFYQRQESKKTRFYPKTLRLYYHYHPHRIVCLDKWISLCETNSPMIGCTFKVLLTDSSHLCEACSSGSYRVTQTEQWLKKRETEVYLRTLVSCKGPVHENQGRENLLRFP